MSRIPLCFLFLFTVSPTALADPTATGFLRQLLKRNISDEHMPIQRLADAPWAPGKIWGLYRQVDDLTETLKKEALAVYNKLPHAQNISMDLGFYTQSGKVRATDVLYPESFLTQLPKSVLDHNPQTLGEVIAECATSGMPFRQVMDKVLSEDVWIAMPLKSIPSELKTSVWFPGIALKSLSAKIAALETEMAKHYTLLGTLHARLVTLETDIRNDVKNMALLYEYDALVKAYVQALHSFAALVRYRNTIVRESERRLGQVYLGEIGKQFYQPVKAESWAVPHMPHIETIADVTMSRRGRITMVLGKKSQTIKKWLETAGKEMANLSPHDTVTHILIQKKYLELLKKEKIIRKGHVMRGVELMLAQMSPNTAIGKQARGLLLFTFRKEWDAIFALRSEIADVTEKLLHAKDSDRIWFNNQVHFKSIELQRQLDDLTKKADALAIEMSQKGLLLVQPLHIPRRYRLLNPFPSRDTLPALMASHRALKKMINLVTANKEPTLAVHLQTLSQMAKGHIALTMEAGLTRSQAESLFSEMLKVGGSSATRWVPYVQWLRNRQTLHNRKRDIAKHLAQDPKTLRRRLREQTKPNITSENMENIAAAAHVLHTRLSDLYLLVAPSHRRSVPELQKSVYDSTGKPLVLSTPMDDLPPFRFHQETSWQMRLALLHMVQTGDAGFTQEMLKRFRQISSHTTLQPWLQGTGAQSWMKHFLIQCTPMGNAGRARNLGADAYAHITTPEAWQQAMQEAMANRHPVFHTAPSQFEETLSTTLDELTHQRVKVSSEK